MFRLNVAIQQNFFDSYFVSMYGRHQDICEAGGRDWIVATLKKGTCRPRNEPVFCFNVAFQCEFLQLVAQQLHGLH